MNDQYPRTSSFDIPCTAKRYKLDTCPVFITGLDIQNLEGDTKVELEEIKSIYDELGTASMLKESLRSIYSIAEFDFEAEIVLNQWCKIAIETGISY